MIFDGDNHAAGTMLDPWVCPLCGGTEIEHLVWADPNTNAFLDYVMNGEERWCRTCEEHPTEFIKKSEYAARAKHQEGG